MRTPGISWLDAEAGPLEGELLREQWCPVTGQWVLLVAAGDGRLHAVKHDGLDVRVFFWEMAE